MSFQTLLKSASQSLRQPTGIAAIASIGLHGLVGFSLPLLNPSQEEPDLQQRVQVVELTPEQRLRLPQEVLPQPALNSLSGNLPINPNALNPSLSNRIPNLSLVPYGNPSYRIPFPASSGVSRVPWVPNTPTVWGAGPRTPLASSQQSVPITVDPFFDDRTFQAAVPTWDVKPDADNLQIHGKPNQATENTNPEQPPQPSENADPALPPSPEDPQPSASLPEKIPTQAVEDLRKLQAQQGQLFAYNSDGTSVDEGYNNTQNWAEKMLTQAETADYKQLVIQPTYPPQAKSGNLSGRAVVGVLVDGNGQIVSEPELIQSTGYPILNQAAIATVQAYEFPATSKPQPYLITIKFDPQVN